VCSAVNTPLYTSLTLSFCLCALCLSVLQVLLDKPAGLVQNMVGHDGYPHLQVERRVVGGVRGAGGKGWGEGHLLLSTCLMFVQDNMAGNGYMRSTGIGLIPLSAVSYIDNKPHSLSAASIIAPLPSPPPSPPVVLR